MGFWTGKKAVLVGGAGFVGSHVAELLLKQGARVAVADKPLKTFPKNLADMQGEIDLIPVDLYDLEESRRAFRGQDIAFNLAARHGSIDYNRRYPGSIFHDCVRMSLNMLEAARLEDVERCLVVSSSCVYPEDAQVPTPETEGFRGDPEHANFGYGWAKRVAEIQARTYADEYGMKIGIVRPFHSYGPRDRFDPEISHVVAALIKRVFDGDDPITVWGDGSQIRSFLYVKDFARGLVDAIEKDPECDPLNIGSDIETSVKDLAALIIRLSGKGTGIVFDETKTVGLHRRNCDISKAGRIIGFAPQWGLEQGLSETIDWYRREFGV